MAPPTSKHISLTDNTVTIETNRPLTNFAWVRLEHDFVGDQFIFLPSEEPIKAVPELLPGAPFTIYNFIDNGTMPTNAVSFTDQYGEVRYFTFSHDNSLGLEPSPFMPDFHDYVVDGQVQIYAVTGGGTRTDLGYFDVDANNFDPETWFMTNSYRWAAHAMVIWELQNIG